MLWQATFTKKVGLLEKWWMEDSPAVTHQSFWAGREGGLKRDREIRPNALQTFQEEGLISATHYYSAKIPH